MTKEAFMNALTVDMALGCSTNSMLHLPAIAHESRQWILRSGLLPMRSARELRTCAIWHRQVPTYMEDLNEAGGVYAVMNELTKKDLLNTGLHDCDRKDSRRKYQRMCQPESGGHPSDRQSLQLRPADWQS